MLNPVQIEIGGINAESRFIIVEPILENKNGKITSTGTFKIFKDGFGEQSALFTEPLEINETGSKLADSLNPDFLGMIACGENGTTYYLGNLLNASEQAQAIKAIQNFR